MPISERSSGRSRSGRIGRLELVSITSRDPGPPPAAYIEVSGGLYRDMMIHDFDLARWLLGEEPVEVLRRRQLPGRARDRPPRRRRHGAGDPQDRLGQARARSAARGARPTATTSALEVHGSKGMARAENVRLSSVEIADEAGWHGEKPPHFFIERYAAAYRAELDHFAACLAAGQAAEPVRRGRPARAGAGRRRGRIAPHRPRRRAGLINRARPATGRRVWWNGDRGYETWHARDRPCPSPGRSRSSSPGSASRRSATSTSTA